MVMNPKSAIGPQTHIALMRVGGFFYEAVSADHDVDFRVSARRQPDGSLILKVVHTSGAFQLLIPREERRAELGRDTGLRSVIGHA